MFESANSSKTTANCVGAILSSNKSACSAECVLPCSELQYDTSLSLTPWPRPSDVGTMFFSAGLYNDSRFVKLFNIPVNATDEEIYNATTTPAAINYFQSRFLLLEVQFRSQSFVELKDVAAFSVDAMGAQIGGVLSLWLGVTVMFAFEAFEFLYIYLTHWCKKEPTQSGQTSTAPSAETELSQSVVVQIE